MDWATLFQVWLLIAITILVSGIIGLVLSKLLRVNDSDLWRFIIALLIGVSGLIAFIVLWPAAIFLLLGSVVFVVFRTIRRERLFRESVENRGYSWSLVKFSRKNKCFGFCPDRGHFFEITGDLANIISRDVVEDFYFCQDGGAKSIKFDVRGEDLFMRDFDRQVVWDDFFLLVIEGQCSSFEVAELDTIEIIDAAQWLEKCLTRNENSGKGSI